MSQPAYLDGDPASNSKTSDTTAEVQCDDCIWEGTIDCEMEIRHQTVYLWGDWVCPNPECGARHSLDQEFDARDYFYEG